MPKQHLDRGLEVVYLFAAQRSAINISLSAIGLLWNATDLLGRSRAVAAAAAASATAATLPSTPSGLQGALSTVFSILVRKSSNDESAAVAAVAAANASSANNKLTTAGSGAGSAAAGGDVTAAGKSVGGAGDGDGYQDAHLAGRNDLSEGECTELLLRLFTHLRKISMDPRPEVRSGCMQLLQAPCTWLFIIIRWLQSIEQSCTR